MEKILAISNENIMNDKTKRALEYFKKTLGEDSEEYKLLKKVLMQEKKDDEQENQKWKHNWYLLQ